MADFAATRARLGVCGESSMPVDPAVPPLFPPQTSPAREKIDLRSARPCQPPHSTALNPVHVSLYMWSDVLG
jgi:hypothetical protein